MVIISSYSKLDFYKAVTCPQSSTTASYIHVAITCVQKQPAKKLSQLYEETGPRINSS